MAPLSTIACFKTEETFWVFQNCDEKYLLLRFGGFIQIFVLIFWFNSYCVLNWLITGIYYILGA